MKNVLLDTHVALWVFEGASILSQKAMAILNDPEVSIFVSPISAYELALKATLGKLASLPKPFAVLADLSDFSILLITMER